MKTKTLGDYFFMVAIYYTDEAGCMNSFHEKWSRKEYAQNAKEFYERRVGKWFDGVEFSGKIETVFTYKCKLCTIA